MRNSIGRSLFLVSITCATLWAEAGGTGGTEAGGPPPLGDSTQTAAPPDSGMGTMVMLLVMVGVMVLFMWSGARRQKKEQRQHQQMVNEMKTGQGVVTAGGVHGTVVRKGETTVDVRTGGDDGSVITFGLNAINKVLDGASSSDDK